MKTTSRHGTGRKLLVAMLAGALVLPVSTADAWWGPGGPVAWGWDPQEAYLHEYGYDYPCGPTPGDIRCRQRNNWRVFMGYPFDTDTWDRVVRCWPMRPDSTGASSGIHGCRRPA